MRTLNVIYFFALIFVSGCEEPTEGPIQSLPVTKSKPLLKETPPPMPVSLPENVKQSSQQLAFCKNLGGGYSAAQGKFENWIAVVSSVSIQANGELRIELLTPCVRIISSPGWRVDKEEPIYSQLKQFKKGSFVLISGQYDFMRGTGLKQNIAPTIKVQISYLAKAWLG